MRFVIGTPKHDTIKGSSRHDWIFAGKGHDDVMGRGGNDVIHGGRGRDTIDGGPGADAVFAGRGNDTAVFDASDRRGRLPDVYDGGRGNDTLRIELTDAQWDDRDIRAEIAAYLDRLDTRPAWQPFHFTTLGLIASRFEHLELVVDGDVVDPAGDPPVLVDDPDSTEDQEITTGSGDDRVTTGSGNDIIDTGDGDDVIISGAGNDRVIIGDGDDVVFAGEGDDTIVAGNAGGNDFIDGGLGIDTVDYLSLNANQPVTIDLRAFDRSADPAAVALLTAQGLAPDTPVGLANGGDYVGTDVLISIEHAFGGSGNDQIIGTDDTNLLDGRAGNDVLSGFGGSDLLRGDAGDDEIFGGADSDSLEGGTGNDTIDGGTGFDQLILSGNRADYTFITNPNGTYTVIDTVAGRDGEDLIRSIEQIVFADTTVGIFTVAGRFTFEGTSASEILEGTDSLDRFLGFEGDDTLLGLSDSDDFIGGPGNDVFDGGVQTNDDANSVLDAVDYWWDAHDGANAGYAVTGVVVDLANGTATDPFGDTDTLLEIERIYATEFADVLMGSDDGTEFFDPHGGNDEIDGRGGFDSLNYHLSAGLGGLGGIVVLFSQTEAGAGTVLVDPFGDTDVFTGIEAMRATRFADMLTGGIGSQRFDPVDGADTIDGGADFDEVRFSVDANYGGFGGIVADLSVLDGQGFATVIDGFGNADLLRNIERIWGTGSSDVLIGGAEAIEFRGFAGDDQLDGGLGDDELDGDLGDDALSGHGGADSLFGGAGSDTITGGEGDDFLRGGFDDDAFVYAAGDGNDTIDDFALGEDSLILQGGLTIVAVAEAGVGGDAGPDTILTLSSGATMTLLDVSGITDPDALLG